MIDFECWQPVYLVMLCVVLALVLFQCSKRLFELKYLNAGLEWLAAFMTL